MKYIKLYDSFQGTSSSQLNTDQKIEEIKNFLIHHYGFSSWEEFVGSQAEGDCQEITEIIAKNFPYVKRMSGEFDVDMDEDVVWHYWVEFDNDIFDFSKGTLYDYMNVSWSQEFFNDVRVGDEWRRYQTL